MPIAARSAAGAWSSLGATTLKVAITASPANLSTSPPSASISARAQRWKAATRVGQRLRRRRRRRRRCSRGCRRTGRSPGALRAPSTLAGPGPSRGAGVGTCAERRTPTIGPGRERSRRRAPPAGDERQRRGSARRWRHAPEDRPRLVIARPRAGPRPARARPRAAVGPAPREHVADVGGEGGDTPRSATDCRLLRHRRCATRARAMSVYDAACVAVAARPWLRRAGRPLPARRAARAAPRSRHRAARAHRTAAAGASRSPRGRSRPLARRGRSSAARATTHRRRSRWRRLVLALDERRSGRPSRARLVEPAEVEPGRPTAQWRAQRPYVVTPDLTTHLHHALGAGEAVLEAAERRKAIIRPSDDWRPGGNCG